MKPLSPAVEARRTLLGIEIPRDELALQIARGCIGLVPPPGTNEQRQLLGKPSMIEEYRADCAHALTGKHAG